MKWGWAVLLLAGLPGLLWAQGIAAAGAPQGPTARGFELSIQAPEEIRSLLERHLELLRLRELTDLSDSELSRLLGAARQNTQDLVATLGYFSPDIEVEIANTSGAATRQVKLSVTPGEPTLVRELHIELTGPIASDPALLARHRQIKGSWLLRPGARFTQSAWDAAKRQALRQLTQLRYPGGRISQSVADIDPVSRSARLSIALDSGPPYRLGELVISGRQRYDTDLITRLVRLPAGSHYEQAHLVQAQQRLADSGYFDSVFVTLDTSGDPQAAAVRVQLREALLQKLVLGVGASTDSGARLSAEHTHHKVPGIGWRAVSKLSLDRETHSLGSELTAPPTEDSWRWITAALLQKQQLGNTEVSSQRLRVGRSQSGEQIDRNYYLQYDRSSTTGSDALSVEADSLSANYAVTLRNFDSLPFASRGWGLGVEIGGGSTLGSQRDPYGRVLARWLGYRSMGRSSDDAPPERRVGRLALRAEAGAVLARDGATLPATQLFLTGGDNSVRGYGYHDLGVSLADGQTRPGRYLTMGSVEWQRPITRNGQLTDWESTLFIDAGAVADKPADLRAKVGLGAGARWKSPVGPLQIDLAYGLAVHRLRLHLNVGFTF